MKLRSRTRRRLKWAGLGLGVAAAGTAATIAMTQAAAEPPPVSQQVQEYYNLHTAAPAAGGDASPGPTPAPLTIPENARALFFGDSWSGGYSADPGRGFAYVTSEIMGWEPVIDAGSGTGFVAVLNEGQPYEQRVEAIPADETADVVVLQGGTNDLFAPKDNLAPAVDATLAEMRGRFPEADIIVVGPGTVSLPEGPELWNVDRIIAARTAKAGLHYISPTKEDWVTPDNLAEFIDPDTLHPSTEGHRQYAERLAAAIKALPAG